MPSDSPTRTLSDCKALCRKNCSCFAYSSANENGTGCYIYEGRVGALEFTTKVTDLYTRGTVSAEGEGKRFEPWMIAVIVVPLLVLLSGFIFTCLLTRKHRRKRAGEALLLELGTDARSDEIRSNKSTGPELPILSFAGIVAATDNFSDANRLGKGGFGPVYKEGVEVAVKRLSRSSGQGLEEFKNEIKLIAKLQHMNLVRLLGCCIEGQEKMLIYEYMPNKSLDFFIFDPDKKDQLDWQRRAHIVEGIAQGLLYLHKYSRLRIIHRDLKASNILLDGELNPKISDFGMAGIFGRKDSEATTNRVVGTYGYMSPEYAMEGHFSEKSDVFSFGVLLLEIISGQRNTSFYMEDHPNNLLGYAWDLWKDGSVLQLLDPVLRESSATTGLSRYVQLALLCVQENAADRPTMFDVVSILSNETAPLRTPEQPAFRIWRCGVQQDGAECEEGNCSINQVTVSIIEAR